jgi:hypothetical protein
MKHAITLVAAAGLASVLALPASAETGQRSDGLRNKAQVEHTDISSRRYYRHYGYGPRYGYYRPYGYGYRPYGYGYRPYYAPGVSLGFYGGPRFGVWF